MEIYINIDGVLRNLIQKFNYHYNDAFLDSEFEPNNIKVSELPGMKIQQLNNVVNNIKEEVK